VTRQSVVIEKVVSHSN